MEKMRVVTPGGCSLLVYPDKILVPDGEIVQVIDKRYCDMWWYLVITSKGEKLWILEQYLREEKP